MASLSPAGMMPWSASMAAWAFEPLISWGARRWSKSTEALIRSMIADGSSRKRPPRTGLLSFLDDVMSAAYTKSEELQTGIAAVPPVFP